MKMLVVLNNPNALASGFLFGDFLGGRPHLPPPGAGGKFDRIFFSFDLPGVKARAHQLTGSLTADPDGVGLVKNGRVIIDGLDGYGAPARYQHEKNAQTVPLHYVRDLANTALAGGQSF